MWNVASIAHWDNIETQGEYMIHRNTIGGLTWIRLYRGTPDMAAHVATLRQGKKMLTNPITGQRFGSVEKVIAFDKARRAA